MSFEQFVKKKKKSTHKSQITNEKNKKIRLVKKNVKLRKTKN